MRTLQSFVAAVLLVVATASCQEAPEQVPTERPSGDLIQGAPLYQPAVLVQTRSSRETFEMVFQSPSPLDSVADWYRRQAADREWNILGDVRMADGGISMTFERDGPGLWLLVRPGQDGEGTEFSLIGAAADTTKQEP